MLTRAGLTILIAGFGLLTSGLAMGNLYWATLSLVPLAVLFAALAVEAPGRIHATLTVGKAAPRQGETVVVEVAYEVARGVGAVELHVPLPDAFELAEGRNVHLVAKPVGKVVSGTFSFTARAAKRGQHEVGPLLAESVHGALVRAPARGPVAPAVRLDVKPEHAPVRRIRGLPGLARQMFPDNDAAVAGIRTNDFREIREYHVGDSMKSVNWRATTRLAAFHAGAAAPLVNDYEREGKKSVWLFLDAAPYMKVGTSLDNSFEHALKAAGGIAQHYLDRGYRLGAYVYNHDRTAFLYPDTGGKQLLRWQRAVTRLDTGPDASEGFLRAVERAHRFLLQEKPLVVVVTRMGKANEAFFYGLRKLRGVTGRRRRRLPILIVTPVVHAAIPNPAEYGPDVVALLRRRDRPAIQRARRAGARVVEWDPTRARFEALLMRGAARARGGGGA